MIMFRQYIMRSVLMSKKAFVLLLVTPFFSVDYVEAGFIKKIGKSIGSFFYSASGIGASLDRTSLLISQAENSSKSVVREAGLESRKTLNKAKIDIIQVINRFDRSVDKTSRHTSKLLRKIDKIVERSIVEIRRNFVKAAKQTTDEVSKAILTIINTSFNQVEQLRRNINSDIENRIKQVDEAAKNRITQIDVMLSKKLLQTDKIISKNIHSIYVGINRSMNLLPKAFSRVMDSTVFKSAMLLEQARILTDIKFKSMFGKLERNNYGPRILALHLTNIHDRKTKIHVVYHQFRFKYRPFLGFKTVRKGWFWLKKKRVPIYGSEKIFKPRSNIKQIRAYLVKLGSKIKIQLEPYGTSLAGDLSSGWQVKDGKSLSYGTYELFVELFQSNGTKINCFNRGVNLCQPSSVTFSILPKPKQKIKYTITSDSLNSPVKIKKIVTRFQRFGYIKKNKDMCVPQEEKYNLNISNRIRRKLVKNRVEPNQITVRYKVYRDLDGLQTSVRTRDFHLGQLDFKVSPAKYSHQFTWKHVHVPNAYWTLFEKVHISEEDARKVAVLYARLVQGKNKLGKAILKTMQSVVEQLTRWDGQVKNKSKYIEFTRHTRCQTIAVDIEVSNK